MILIDTGPLVALCEQRDRLFPRATADFATLVGEQFFICSPVLSEAAFHLRTATRRRRLRAFVQTMRSDFPGSSKESDVWPEVFDWLERYSDHSPDWTDALLVVLSGKDARYKVWTYDGQFRTVWRRPDGTPVPLAVDSE